MANLDLNYSKYPQQLWIFLIA